MNLPFHFAFTRWTWHHFLEAILTRRWFTTTALSVCLFLSVFVLVSMLGWGFGEQAFFLPTPPLVENVVLRGLVLAFSIIMASLSILGLSNRFIHPKKRDLIEMPGASGVVTIPTRVLEDFLQREAVRLPGVDALKVRMIKKSNESLLSPGEKNDGDWYEFHLEAWITTQKPPQDILKDIAAFVETRTQEILGTESKVEIHLEVRHISGDLRPIPLHASQLEQSPMLRVPAKADSPWHNSRHGRNRTHPHSEDQERHHETKIP